MKDALSFRKMQPTPKHPAWKVEPETELSLLQSGTPWDKHNLYNCTCDPETRGGKPCLEGPSEAQSAISSKCPNRQHCGCGGTAIPGLKSGSGATNMAASPSQGPSELSTKMKRLIWPGVTMGNITGES